MLERFICVFGINPDPQVIDKLFKELILFTARAAYAWLFFNELLYIIESYFLHGFRQGIGFFLYNLV